MSRKNDNNIFTIREYLEVVPIQSEIIRLIPFEPRKTRRKGLNEVIYTSSWGQVKIYGAETMNSFDLKVFMALSNLLYESLKAGNIYSAGENIYRWKEDGEERDRKEKLIGLYTTASHFLTKHMHLTRYKANMDAVWNSFMRYYMTVWIFKLKNKERIAAKIVHGAQQTKEGWVILVSERYAKKVKKMSNVLGIANSIIQSLKNDTAVLLSCWLQGQSVAKTFYLRTIADAIRIQRDKRTTERIRRAFEELKAVGQIEKYEIEKNGKNADTWKIHFEQNKSLLSDLKAEMSIAKKTLPKKPFIYKNC